MRKPRHPRLRTAVAVFCVLALGGWVAADPGKPAEARRQAWLGVWLSDAVDGGSRVVALVPQGPAQLGGMQAGDIILEANGTPVRDQDRLGDLLSRWSPGDSVRFSLVRAGRPLDLSVTLGDRTPSPQPRIRLESRVRGALPGLQVTEITPALREHFGAPADTGVLVVRIDPATLGAGVDLRVGDVLTRLGEQEIRERQQLERTLRTWNWDRPLRARLIRGGQPRDVELNRPAVAGENQRLEMRLEQEIERLEQRLEALRGELEAIRERP